MKVNLAYIDKVVIVCAGRIEMQHAAAIKQFMEWLSHKDYKENFVLIYNKSDLLSQQQRMENLESMCKLFEVPMTNQFVINTNGIREAIRMNLAVGFPPNSDFVAVEDDHRKLAWAVTIPHIKGARIPVDKSRCTIL